MSVPVIKTELPGPNAKAIIDRDTTVVSPSYTRGYPLVIERGSGAMVEDVDGNVFLDCAAGIAVNSTGHSHPDVVKAITDQAGKFLHMSGTDFYYEPQVRLAEELAAIAPVRGERSEEHTPELQSHSDLVCRLVLEKKTDWRPDRGD